ncbi:hypothetical protein VTK73DRAFT_6123 [Phialemonium thermophilum]|uniref:SH3 domain-containing protein n=1 Tax=Phialemonium thermophilum TaxID=223376 RepID=A0ABR3WKR3_9PEZI
MQAVQRRLGKLRNKTPGDNVKTSVLISDFEDADALLAKIIEGCKSWRESWLSLLDSQLQIVIQYRALYEPIAGASDGRGREAVPTSDYQLNRVSKLETAYSDLKTELFEELGQIDNSVVKPAVDARDCIQPVRKDIKKRENKRLDYENSQARVKKLQLKSGRSAKEDASLAKAEQEMARLADEFTTADAHLWEKLPPIVTASFNMIPALLATHILIQNRLLGLYYTTLNAYCSELGFPSPPPPMDNVIDEWNTAFSPIRGNIESLSCISRGRAIHQPMDVQDGSESAGKSFLSPLAPRNGFRRSTSALTSSPGNEVTSRPPRIPSADNILATQTWDERPHRAGPGPRGPDRDNPTDFTTASVLGTSTASSTSSFASHSSLSSAAARGNLLMSQVKDVAKRKRAPPPPPKRIPSANPDQFVIAQYDFPGQGRGDLSFRQGDRIKIVQKTGTDQDWWVGELAGVTGSFPANYCKSA